MPRKTIWRSPEEIVEIAFQRAPVVIMNEAHNGWKRCIRTRRIGQRILPVAHQAGVRHLAMEALFPAFAEEGNRTRRLMKSDFGYLSQPEMKDFIQAALDVGWTLIPYEADHLQWLSAKHDIKLPKSNNPYEMENVLRSHQAEFTSMEFTNWREEQQARNIIHALEALPEHTPLLVWCGNSHHAKTPVIQDWIPMGYQFKTLSGIDPFAIDQTRTVNFGGGPYQSELAGQFSKELAEYGDIAGFLLEEAPDTFPHNADADAFLLSTQNDME